MKVAARAGVAAFLVAPLQPAQLAPTLDLAVARFGDREVLRRKLAERKVIERAKGRLMTVARLSEDDAFRWLRTRAMQTRSTLADVAHTVLGDGAARDGAKRGHALGPPGQAPASRPRTARRTGESRRAPRARPALRGPRTSLWGVTRG